MSALRLKRAEHAEGRVDACWVASAQGGHVRGSEHSEQPEVRTVLFEIKRDLKSPEPSIRHPVVHVSLAAPFHVVMVTALQSVPEKSGVINQEESPLEWLGEVIT